MTSITVRREERVGVVAEQLAESAVDLEPAAVEADERDPDRGVVERGAERARRRAASAASACFFEVRSRQVPTQPVRPPARPGARSRSPRSRQPPVGAQEAVLDGRVAARLRGLAPLARAPARGRRDGARPSSPLPAPARRSAPQLAPALVDVDALSLGVGAEDPVRRVRGQRPQHLARFGERRRPAQAAGGAWMPGVTEVVGHHIADRPKSTAQPSLERGTAPPPAAAARSPLPGASGERRGRGRGAQAGPTHGSELRSRNGAAPSRAGSSRSATTGVRSPRPRRGSAGKARAGAGESLTSEGYGWLEQMPIGFR